jgi:hypothetical protein
MLQRILVVVLLLVLAVPARGITPDERRAAVKARAEKEKADKEAKKRAKQDELGRPQREAEAREAAKASADREAVLAQHLAEILEKGKAWDAEQEQLPADERPYDVKGDRLGMPLVYYKVKHRREIKGESRTAPFCSDQNPGFENPFLLYEPDMGKAGIVCATLHYPFEMIQDEKVFPTIAGVKADTFVYKFIDERLYEIVISIDHDDYDTVIDAAEKKYGEPITAKTETYQNGFGAKFDGDVLTWANSASTITVLERAGKLDRSMFLFSTRKGRELEKSRMKSKAAKATDDL